MKKKPRPEEEIKGKLQEILPDSGDEEQREPATKEVCWG